MGDQRKKYGNLANKMSSVKIRFFVCNNLFFIFAFIFLQHVYILHNICFLFDCDFFLFNDALIHLFLYCESTVNPIQIQGTYS